MMNRGVRIYDLARRLAVPSRDLLDVLKDRGIEVASHMSTIDNATADILLKMFGGKKSGDARRSDRAHQERQETAPKSPPSSEPRPKGAGEMRGSGH
jgi:translation initiation factor IF-2